MSFFLLQFHNYWKFHLKSPSGEFKMVRNVTHAEYCSVNNSGKNFLFFPLSKGKGEMLLLIIEGWAKKSGCDGCGNVDCGCSAIFLFDNRVAKGKYWWAGSKILLYRQHTKGSRFPLQIIFFGKKTFKSKKLPQYSMHSLGLNRNSGWYIAIFDVMLQNLTLNCNILAWYCNILAQCWIFWLIVAIYWLDNQSNRGSASGGIPSRQLPRMLWIVIKLSLSYKTC